MYSKSERKTSMFLLSRIPVKSKHFWLANMNGAMMKFKSSFRDVLSFAPPALFSSKCSLHEENSFCFVSNSILVTRTFSISNMLFEFSRTLDIFFSEWALRYTLRCIILAPSKACCLRIGVLSQLRIP